MQTTDYILQVEHISKAFPGVQALDDVTLSIKPGEVHALVGENGAGKSTLMNVIFGAIQPDTGTLLMNGEPLRIQGPKDALDRGIAMIFQEISLIPDLSIAENIFLDRFPRKSKGKLIDWKTLYHDTQEILAQIGLKLDPKTLVKDISIGHQQMLEIARAISANAKIVIMDEPTSSLSGPESQKLFELIEFLQSRNIAVIYISHRMEEIFSITNRVSVLRDGKYIATLDIEETDEDTLVALMVGRHIGDMYAERKSFQGGHVALDVRSLHRKGFFEDINFTLNAGEVLGFYGLVGAGRTELALSLFGHYPIDSGTVLVRETPVKISSPPQAIAHGISYLPEDRKDESIFPILSVKENISMSSIAGYSRFTFIDKPRERQEVEDYIERLRIRTPSGDTPIETLSGGNQQKAIISRILALNPQVLILDEPTRGIDVGAKSEVHHIIEELAEQGVAIMLISSEMPEILAISDRVVVMKNGRISGTFSRDEADQETLLHAASL